MDNLSNFIQSVGVMAEMTAIFYNALVDAGLSEDIAVTLTAKMIGEVLRSNGSTKKEDEQ